MFKECITLCNGTLQKSSAILHFFWIFYCFQCILHRLRELSYGVSLCCWHFQRNTASSRKVLLHLSKYASCYYMCLRIQHASKECCVHSKTFFQGKTCLSTTACIPLNEIVQSSQECLQHSILLQSNVTCSQRNTPPFPPKYPKVSVYRYLYTLIEYIKPRQECVCTYPTFQDSKICTGLFGWMLKPEIQKN